MLNKMLFNFNGKKVKSKGPHCTILANSILMATLSGQPGPHLFFRLTVLPLPRLLLDVSDHGKGSTIVAVGQVDDIGNGRKHGSLAAGTNGCALLTHGQEELERIMGNISLMPTPDTGGCEHLGAPKHQNSSSQTDNPGPHLRSQWSPSHCR